MNVVCGWERRLIGRLRGVTCSLSSPHSPMLQFYLCHGMEKGLNSQSYNSQLSWWVPLKMHVALLCVFEKS